MRMRALLVVLLVWAAIYLPGLGTLEIKGEEGRRILPAVTMLQTGNYLVPQVGSEPYFRKPPLVNWLVAASFKIFGERNEWAARLPSAFCVLAVALAFVTIARGALGANGSLGAALIWMTNLGILEKGRLIEIEALYVSLGGLAFVCWMSWWQERRSPWLTWTVPWIFLGLGLLAKGPVLLIFFYAVVLGILFCWPALRPEGGPSPGAPELAMMWRRPALGPLLHPAHLLGIVLMLGIFLAWAIPCLLTIQNGNVTHIWTRQFSGRLSGEDFKLGGWLLNIPRGLGYFLPWTALLFFFRRTPSEDARRAAMARGLLWGIGLSFVGVSLLPGTLARYTMPLLAPASWLAAMIIAPEKSEHPRWLQRAPFFVAALACLVIGLYAFAVMPRLKKREKVRTLAAQINAVLPPNEPLYAVDPDYQPFLFYVRDPIVYVDQVAEVPTSGRYLLVQRAREEEALASDRWQPRKAHRVLAFKDYRNKEVSVMELGEGG